LPILDLRHSILLLPGSTERSGRRRKIEKLAAGAQNQQRPRVTARADNASDR
jgi:hypothetical protein